MMHVAPEDLAMLERQQMVCWRGRSGREFWFRPVPLDRLSLAGGELAILTLGDGAAEHVIWAGTGEEVVADPGARAMFRRGLDLARAAYTLPAPRDARERLTLLWELESARGTADPANRHVSAA